MLKSILPHIFGAATQTFIVINTLFTATLLFPLALIKFIIPFKWWRLYVGKLLIKVANNWVFRNSCFFGFFYPIEWNISGLDKLKRKDWYLIISNHQSWVDILVIQKVLYGKIPYIKFFLKQELIWVPVLGLAWWALDFPFMKRFSKTQIEKNPSLKGKDIEITRKACEKFKTDYVAVMTFPEGTRFTKEKHDSQNSPYTHLLKPKAGGLFFIMSAMGDRFHSILNITIVYPEGIKSLWEFFCGKVKKIDITIESIPLPQKFSNADIEDKELQTEFNNWLNNMWQRKDSIIGEKMPTQ